MSKIIFELYELNWMGYFKKSIGVSRLFAHPHYYKDGSCFLRLRETIFNFFQAWEDSRKLQRPIGGRKPENVEMF